MAHNKSQNYYELSTSSELIISNSLSLLLFFRSTGAPETADFNTFETRELPSVAKLLKTPLNPAAGVWPLWLASIASIENRKPLIS
ncbi:hypothetical protein NQ314_014501 [Rhamnusium bicolor]|uniref:Uncharacterized protein n=1 Tax=Rhamnusium bicolor TaxID=1586634 RepID=A0AAV8X2K2_9CUCU|nr:hypothetical protein NQ314_014501 [Rhamnusium bicolor]